MTDQLRQAAQQALEALEGWENCSAWVWPETALEQSKRNTTESLAALRAALEQQQAEPLTDEEIVDIRRKTKPTHDRAWADTISFARAIEAKLKEQP